MFKINLEFDTSDINESDWYKQGIYKITNKKNGHFYIGSVRGTGTFRNRFCCHRQAFLNYTARIIKNGCTILYRAFDRHGLENFKIEILEILKDPKYILEREEYYINTLNPQYNICKYPTKSGCPNKNRKLTKIWKERIRAKSKLYKHNSITLEKVTNNNKENACKLTFKNTTKSLHFNSWVEARKYFGLNSSSGMMAAYKNHSLYRGYIIIKNSLQKKRVKVFFPNKCSIYDSFNACDRALNMWRGYTSTMYTRGIELLKDKYKYEVI